MTTKEIISKLYYEIWRARSTMKLKLSIPKDLKHILSYSRHICIVLDTFIVFIALTIHLLLLNVLSHIST